MVNAFLYRNDSLRSRGGGGGSYKAINIKTILSATDLLSCCYRYKQYCYDLHITAPLNIKKSLFKIAFSEYFTFFTRIYRRLIVEDKMVKATKLYMLNAHVS